MSWVAEEFKDIDLDDRRLDKRTVLLAERLVANSLASIPQACGGWAETQAAYRFLAQDNIEWEAIHTPHWQSAEERMRAQRVVLCLQDTTEPDFNGQRIAGLGPLSHEAQRGMYVHPAYAVSPEREPLGVLDAWMWAREPKDAHGARGGLLESTRWAEEVADREADIVALMVQARDLGHPADWLIRSRHDRALPEGGKLWGSVTAGETLGGIRFTMPVRPGQKARQVRQRVWTKRTSIPDGRGGQVEVSCLLAREEGAPAGVKPMQWRLRTNRPIGTFAAAAELIDWYRAHWEIERFFHVLKNGCRVEALQLSTVQRLERALALFMVVAWRIARLMRLGRTCPDLEAALLFERDEWQAAYILNRKKVPTTPPRLTEGVRLVAMLGGFLAQGRW